MTGIEGSLPSQKKTGRTSAKRIFVKNKMFPFKINFRNYLNHKDCCHLSDCLTPVYPPGDSGRSFFSRVCLQDLYGKKCSVLHPSSFQQAGVPATETSPKPSLLSYIIDQPIIHKFIYFLSESEYILLASIICYVSKFCSLILHCVK